MFKKFISWVLTAVMLAGILPVSSLAADSSNVNFTHYIFDDFEDGTHIDANSGWQQQLKGNCNFHVDTVPLGGNASNKVLVFDNPAGSEYLTNLNAQELSVSGDLYAEFDICINSAASTTNFAEFFIDGNSASLLRFDISSGAPGSLKANYLRASDKATKQKTLLSSYEFGKWYNFKFIIKTREGKYSVWLDGTLMEEDLAFPMDYSSKTFTDYKLTMFRVQFARAGQLFMDNIDIRTYSPAEFISVSPTDTSSPIHPSDKITVKAGGFADSLEAELNGVPLASDGITQNGDTFTIDPGRLNWDTDYRLSGKVSDMFGGSDTFSVNFTTKPLEGFSVENLGFVNSDGNKITSIVPGNVKARIIYEAENSGTSYVAIAGLYKKVNDVIELVDIVTVTNINAGVYEDVELLLTVPDECENMFIDVYVWKSLSTRTLFDDEAYYGKMRLE
ncbi:MAG: hypothetical protein IKJ68_04635 [Clostridia bacterium]|nr:hypothetical protein [Clostridia bacterium]